MPRINPNAPSKIDARLRKIARDFAKTDEKIDDNQAIVAGGLDDIKILVGNVGSDIKILQTGINVALTGIHKFEPVVTGITNIKDLLDGNVIPTLTGIRGHNITLIERIPVDLNTKIVSIKDQVTGVGLIRTTLDNIRDNDLVTIKGGISDIRSVDLKPLSLNIDTIKLQTTEIGGIKTNVSNLSTSLSSVESNIKTAITNKTFNVDLSPVTKELTNIKNLFPDNFKTNFSTMASQATESHSFLMGAETSTGSFKNYVNNLRLNNDTFVQAANTSINELNSVNASQRLQITSLNNRITSLNQTIDDLRYQLEEMRPTGGGGQTIPTGGVTIPTGGVIPGGGGGSDIM